METNFVEIKKENVDELTFPIEDVLKSVNQKSQRYTALMRAMALGNLEKIKVKIFFEDVKKKLFVYTTIWGVTDESIILKRGLIIPNRRIHKIHL